jgi:predicted secreted acid phosphatase
MVLLIPEERNHPQKFLHRTTLCDDIRLFIRCITDLNPFEEIIRENSQDYDDNSTKLTRLRRQFNKTYKITTSIKQNLKDFDDNSTKLTRLRRQFNKNCKLKEISLQLPLARSKKFDF